MLKTHKNILKIILLSGISFFVLDNPIAFAQIQGDTKKNKNSKRKGKEDKEREKDKKKNRDDKEKDKDKKKNREDKDKEKDKLKTKNKHLDYDYELMTSLGVNYDTGSLNKAGEDAENFNNQTVYFDLMSGILFGDHFEPILEVSLSQTTNTIGDYSETKSNLIWGLGALFNIPTGSKPSKIKQDANTPAFANSTWIPFGGFVFSGTSHDESGGSATKTTIAESGLRTKLIFGSRYMLYPHIGLNFWLRLSYEQSASEVTEPDTTGGTVNKLSIQSNLLSFTMFF